MNEEKERDKLLFGRTFSDDSLGDSTRSLLSPIYNDSGRFESELSEGSLSGDEDVREEDSYQHKDKEYYVGGGSRGSRCSSRNGTTSRSFSNKHGSSDEKSSHKSVESVPSRTPPDRTRTFESSREHDHGDTLSPWENWLVRKTAEERERQKQRRLQKQKEREESERKKKQREELLKAASEKYHEWLEKKTKVIADDRKRKKEETLLEKEKKESLNRSTQEKAEVKYNNWIEEKKEKRLEVRKKEQLEARMKKEKEVERKLRNEEAYSGWMKKVKEKPKSLCNSFAYTGGILSGGYEWGSYPGPSYYNPIPWVPPKVKRNNERRKGKGEVQQPSPPLLFRDIDNRKAMAKKHIIIDNNKLKGSDK